jgi:hypothetical protein
MIETRKKKININESASIILSISAIMDKLSKKGKSEKKSDKKSFLKKFGEAKSLSDLTK